MDTHRDSTITPSAHLSTVKDLLWKLDEMKDGRIGARERLEFLLENGTQVVQDFDFQDAFDVEVRSMSSRIQKIEDLQTNLRGIKAQWADGPLDDDTKEVGEKLVNHLDEFVRQARRKESKTEIEMLEQLWDSSPDISEAFGMEDVSYTPRSQPSRPVQAMKDAMAEQDKKLATKDLEAVAKLRTAKSALEQEVADENLNQLKLPSEAEQIDGLKELYGDKAAELEKKAFEIHEAVVDGIRQEHLAGRKFQVDEEDRVVAQISKSTSPKLEELPAEEVVLQEELEEELDMLDIRSWTLALNEALASNWKFDRQLRGRIGDCARMGITLIWSKGKDELRLDVERLGLDEVLVRLVPPRSSKSWSLSDTEMYRVHAKEMKVAELKELHKDPLEFVKLMLR